MSIDLKSLNPAQYQAVTHIDGPVLIVAGPGSGKTRVITHRIAYMIEQGIPAWSILAVTFTNKAAGEMRERVYELVGEARPHVSTFHSFGASFLRSEAGVIGIPRDFSIYDQGDGRSLIKQICKELMIDTNFLRPAEVQHAISNSKNRGDTPDRAMEQAIGFKDEQIARIYEAYQAMLRRNNAFDFDDLLLEPVKALESDESLRAHYAERYRYVMVDEYQDTNGVQYQLSKLLSTHRNLCVTGDPDQSIYSWRGADLRNILDFERDFPDTHTIVLGQNYRSTQTIVRAADHLVRHNLERKAKELSTSNEQGSDIRVIHTQSEAHEGLVIAQVIQDWVQEEGLEHRSIAVFYRTNAQSRAIERALHETGIPYLIVGAVEFYKRKEIQDVLAWLRLLVNPHDEVAFARALSSSVKGVGAGSIEKIVRFARTNESDLVSATRSGDALKAIRGAGKRGLSIAGVLLGRLLDLKAGPVMHLLQELVTELELENLLRQSDPLKGEERWENVQELLSDAELFDESKDERGLAGYLEKVALVSDTDAIDTTRHAVSLMSLHAAKGLEFDGVVMAGLEDNLLPHSRSIQSGPTEMEEERRLCYVGITRARQHLVMTLASYRSAMGQAMRNAPSRFLQELPQELVSTQDLSGGLGSRTSRPTRASDDDIPFGIDDDEPAAELDLWDDVDQTRQPARLQRTSRPGDAAPAGAPAEPEDVSWGPGLTHIVGGRAKPMHRQSAVREPEKSVLRGFFNEDPLPERPESSPGGQNLQSGDRVRHAMFGIGRVLSVTRHASGSRARILFEGWGEKNMALEFARLDRLS